MNPAGSEAVFVIHVSCCMSIQVKLPISSGLDQTQAQAQLPQQFLGLIPSAPSNVDCALQGCKKPTWNLTE